MKWENSALSQQNRSEKIFAGDKRKAQKIYY